MYFVKFIPVNICVYLIADLLIMDPSYDEEGDPFVDDHGNGLEGINPTAPTNTQHKNYRGKSNCSDVFKARSEGCNYEVEYNRFGRAMGKGGIKMNSTIGLLSRTTLPLDIDNWKQMPKDKKETLWGQIQVSYNINY